MYVYIYIHMDKLRKIYKEIEEKKYAPTSDKQLLQAVDVNIFRHDQLKKIKNIEQLLKNDAAIIFYDSKTSDVGHWVCVTRRGNLIEFFDSFGRNIDYPKYIHGRPPYLKNLLLSSGYDVRYNPYVFQDDKTSTCGRHVITRIIFRQKPLFWYKNFMKNIDHDDLVSFVTLPI